MFVFNFNSFFFPFFFFFFFTSYFALANPICPLFRPEGSLSPRSCLFSRPFLVLFYSIYIYIYIYIPSFPSFFSTSFILFLLLLLCCAFFFQSFSPRRIINSTEREGTQLCVSRLPRQFSVSRQTSTDGGGKKKKERRRRGKTS